MDSTSSTTGGRRRLPTTHYAEDQAFDQIAKEVSTIITIQYEYLLFTTQFFDLYQFTERFEIIVQ